MADDRMFSFENKSDGVSRESWMKKKVLKFTHWTDAEGKNIWEKMVPSGDVLTDRGTPAVSALSLFQARSISDGNFFSVYTLRNGNFYLFPSTQEQIVIARLLHKPTTKIKALSSTFQIKFKYFPL